MRLNRTAQVGLFVIVGALLLAVVLNMSKGPTPPPNSGNSAGVTPVAAQSGQAQPVVLGGPLAARFDIPERSILTRDMFEPAKGGDDASGDAYVTDFRTQGLNFVTAKPIVKGAKLVKTDLLGHLSELGVSAAVRDGMRAMTIAVPTKATLHDIVSIGDYVDVVATFDQVESKILAPGVRVLAVDIYGRDFEKSSLAKRGDRKGDDRPGGAPPPPNPNGQPTAPGEPGAAPTPASGQPQPPKPEMALTLEVKPEQATTITLAQASNAPLEFLLQPRPTTVSVGQEMPARVTKPQVAPYAVAFRRGGDVKAGKALESKGPRIPWLTQGPIIPVPTVGPVQIIPRKTYDVTIYPDGLPARTTTVPLPGK